MSGLFSFHTGQPFSVLTGADTTGTSENVQRVDLVGDPFAGVFHRVVQENGFKYVPWINPAAFALPAAGAYGTMRRNQIYAPGYGNVDLAVFKNFKVNEQFTVRFSSEIFNLFNRVNLAPPFPIGFTQGRTHKMDSECLRTPSETITVLPASVPANHLTFSLP